MLLYMFIFLCFKLPFWNYFSSFSDIIYLKVFFKNTLTFINKNNVSLFPVLLPSYPFLYIKKSAYLFSYPFPPQKMQFLLEGSLLTYANKSLDNYFAGYLACGFSLHHMFLFLYLSMLNHFSFGFHECFFFQKAYFVCVKIYFIFPLTWTFFGWVYNSWVIISFLRNFLMLLNCL